MDIADQRRADRAQQRRTRREQNRRRSYEMDIDEWTPVTDERQIAILVDRLGVPREDVQSIFRSATSLQITFNYGRILIEKESLYKDIGDEPEDEGVFYTPHANILNEVDPWRGPYWVTDYHREMERAVSLSHKPIPDAPRAHYDLPWNMLLRPTHRITIEEMLVYFPNHVARWPGLALALRCQNWNRLFYRAVRIINLARGSHQTPNRDDLHTEVLPFQIKIVRAIREIVPGFDLWDFNPGLAEQYLHNVLHERPRALNQRFSKSCTLQEGAGYISGVNEFQEHSPFSRMMKQYQPNIRPAPTPLRPQFPNGLGDMGAYYAYKVEQGDNFTDWPHEQVQPPFPVCPNDPCEDLNCGMEHRNGERYIEWLEEIRQGHDTQEPQQADSGRRNNGPTDEPDGTRNIQECRDRAACIDPDCEVGHRGPWTNTGVHLRLDRWCRDGPGGVKCTDSTCALAHESWQHLENGNGPQGNINETNGPVHEAMWQQRCRSDPCRNPGCWYGHKGPVTRANVQLQFESRPRCSFDRRCTNAGCDKAHTSPAQDSGSSGGGGDGGHGRPNGGGGGRGNDRGRGNGRGRGNNGRGRGGHRGDGEGGGGGDRGDGQGNGRGRGNDRRGNRGRRNQGGRNRGGRNDDG